MEGLDQYNLLKNVENTAVLLILKSFYRLAFTNKDKVSEECLESNF